MKRVAPGQRDEILKREVKYRNARKNKNRKRHR